MDATEEPFEAALYVVRARRLADLSQRDLASRAGLSSSAVDRIEQGGDVRVRTLTRILALAGLRLAVLDVEGQTVEPFPDDSVRDNGERRFPAHLDVQPPDVLPAEAIDSPRYDRPPPRGWYHHRPVRDLHRAERPPHRDHPTVGELAVRAHLLLLRRIPRERERRLRHPWYGAAGRRGSRAAGS